MLLKKTAQYWVPLLVAALAAGLIVLNMQLSEQFLYQDEFLPRWSAARGWMQDGTSPYSDDAYSEAKALYNETGFSPPAFSQGRFIDLVWYVFLYIPLSFLPYTVARAIWMTLTAAAIFFSIWIGGPGALRARRAVQNGFCAQVSAHIRSSSPLREYAAAVSFCVACGLPQRLSTG